MTPTSVSEAYFCFKFFIVAFDLFDYCEYLGHIVEAKSVSDWSKQPFRKDGSFREEKFFFFFLQNEVFLLSSNSFCFVFVMVTTRMEVILCFSTCPL